MAAPIANTYQTYQTKANREDVSDIISNISPEDTPYVSNVGSGEASFTFHEVLQDSLASASSTNAQIEGFVVDHTAQVPVQRVGNYTQIAAKDVIVSRTADRVKKYGRADEANYLKAKMSAELKRDVEAICLANQAASPGDSATARKTAGLPAWIKTNVVMGTGAAATPVYTNIPSATRTDGTTAAFAEQNIKDAQKSAFSNGGKPRLLLMSPTQCQNFSTFPGVATKTFYTSAVEATKIIGAADVYVGQFGNLAVVPELFGRDRDIFMIDPELCELSWLDNYFQQELAITGDQSGRWLIAGEFANTVKNEKGIAGIFDRS